MPWQIQFTGPIDLGHQVAAYDLDGADTPAGTVAALRARGVRTICYFSAGSREDWRADASTFPASAVGRAMAGWAGEAWLDVRRLDVLMPIMRARIAQCAAKGFDAVDPDNVDGYANDSGFPLTDDDQAAYIIALAAEAHRRGLAMGLKNDVNQVDRLSEHVDFAVNEQCLEFDECGAYHSFLASGKPVFHIEYTGSLPDICRRRPEGFSTVLKNLSLDAYRESCPA